MSEPPATSAPRSPRRWRRAVGIAASVLIALALIAWAAVRYYHDLPRRQVERALAERLGADVSVGALTIDGLRHFVVDDLVVRRMAGQQRLDEVRVARLDVTGSVFEIQQGRFVTLRAEGTTVRLVPPQPSVPPAAGPPVSVSVGRLELVDARILIGSAGTQDTDADPAIALEGTLTGVGGELAGDLVFSSPAIPVDRLVALTDGGAGATGSEGSEKEKKNEKDTAPGSATATGQAGRLEGLEGRITIGESGRKIDASASAARVVLDGSTGPMILPEPSLEAHVRRTTGGPLRIDVWPKLSFAESMSLSALYDDSKSTLISLRAEAREVDVTPLAAIAHALPEGWRIAGRVDLTVTGGAPLLDYDLAARLTSIEVPVQGDRLTARSVTCALGGKIAIGASQGAMPVHGSVEIAAFHGRIQGRDVPLGLEPLRGSIEGTVTRSAASWVSAFAGRASVEAPAIGRFGIDGRASLDAEGTADAGPSTAAGSDPSASGKGNVSAAIRESLGREIDFRWRWEGIDLGRMTDLAGVLGYGLPAGVTAAGRGRAEGTLAGEVGSPRIAGTIALESLRVAGRAVSPGSAPKARAGANGQPSADWELSDGRCDARFAWTGPSGAVDVTSLEMRGRAHAGALEPFAASVRAAARIDPFQGRMDVSQAAIEATGIARLRASASLTRATSSSSSALDAWGGHTALHLEAVDFASLQHTLRPILGDPAPGYAVKGDAEGDASITLSPGGAFAGTGKAMVRHTGFNSSDSSQALEGLDTTWDLSFGGDLTDAHAPSTIHAVADVSGFQLLWGSFFADGSKLPSRLDLSVELSGGIAGAVVPSSAAPSRDASSARPSEIRTKLKADWSFMDGPHFVATATAAGEGAPMAWTLLAESRDLATTFDRFVRAPLGDSIALFRRIEAAGTARVEAHGTWSDAPTASGRVMLAGMRIAGTEKVVEVSGLDLDLPFDLAWGPPDANGARSLRGAPQEGSVRFAHLAAMGLDVPAASTGLRVHADTVELKEGLAVPLLDGVVGFEQLKLIDLLRPTRHLESAMLVSSVSLASVSKAFALPPLEGSADAHFPRVTLSMDAMQVDGGGEVRVFGGAVKLGAISGQDILSRYPKLTMSADFSGIDLAKLTHTFDFGEMTGIVKGYVHDCDLFRGVPTAFDARVETEETRGVSRTVNVKAIQNLTILGTGTRPSIFDRGIHRFFDKYTYSRIGIAMTLKDDVFVLRGLEHRGDQELFVKGRLPFPINVVNAQPGAPISFQDMLERVKNLDVTAATVQH